MHATGWGTPGTGGGGGTLRMRACSAWSFGLWSSVMATAAPARETTQRESPAFATTSSDPATTAATAVHPARGPVHLVSTAGPPPLSALDELTPPTCCPLQGPP